MTDALKPCPFCGTAARFDWEERRGQNFYYAVCPKDECVARMGTDYCETKEAAAAIWNRRTAPPAPAVPDDVAKDAARYRWLRWQGCTFYTDDAPVEINGEQKATKHHVCEWAMDDAVDAAMAVEQEANRG